MFACASVVRLRATNLGYVTIFVTQLTLNTLLVGLTGTEGPRVVVRWSRVVTTVKRVIGSSLLLVAMALLGIAGCVVVIAPEGVLV